jgi:acetyltransferase-like isoleucine patch superfamily enzyme
MRHKPLIIEDEAWVGTHFTVMPRVRNGKGAVASVGSVATRDVASMAIAAHVPARVIANQMTDLRHDRN